MGMCRLTFLKATVQDQVAKVIPSGGAGGYERESARASLLASGRLLAISGVPWLVEASPHLCLCLCMVFFLCACFCVHISPFYKDTHRTGFEFTFLQDDLILTHYICNDPISN